jgi:hypothetical protein
MLGLFQNKGVYWEWELKENVNFTFITSYNVEV